MLELAATFALGQGTLLSARHVLLSTKLSSDMSRPKTALIVDDEAHLRVYIKLILKQLGFIEFYEAKNGQEAIEMYERWAPDITMMDVNMPVKEGMEALEEIMQIDSEAVVVGADDDEFGGGNHF